MKTVFPIGLRLVSASIAALVLSHGAARASAVGEIGFMCANGDSNVQFIALTASTAMETLSASLVLHVQDRYGNATLERSNLFAPHSDGEPWPEDRTWLLGTSLFSADAGIAVDLVIPTVLDLYGGTLTLIDSTTGSVVQRLNYGAAGGVNAPRPGASLRRQNDGTMSENPNPAPTNYSGAIASAIDCPCPTSPARLDSSEVGYYDGTTYQYDLTAGTFALYSGSSSEGGGGRGLDVRDVYTVIGPTAGTPLTFAAQLDVEGYARADPDPFGGHGGAAWCSALLREGDSNDSSVTVGSDNFVRTPLVVTISRSAGEPFRVQVSLACYTNAGSADIRGRLSFRGVPPSSQVVSCQGFMEDVPVPTLASLVGTDVGPDHVSLTWFTADRSLEVPSVERAESEPSWVRIGEASSDGVGRLTFDDQTVRAGHRYGYRLARGAETLTAETWVVVPDRPSLAVRALPNPTGPELAVAFSIPRAGVALFQLVDVAGRVVWTRSFAEQGPGEHRVALGSTSRLPPGIYLLRLTHGGQLTSTRVCVTR